MKYLIAFACLMLLSSCVSQKKYSELENRILVLEGKTKPLIDYTYNEKAGEGTVTPLFINQSQLLPFKLDMRTVPYITTEIDEDIYKPTPVEHD